jgi:hypothetical protein
LLDRIVNAIIEKKQADSPVGYGYLWWRNTWVQNSEYIPNPKSDQDLQD